MPIGIDEIDRKILRCLQRDGRISNTDLAQAVGLSPSPCLRRVRLLEEAGVIQGYSAHLDGTKLDLGMMIFARVWLTQQDIHTVERVIEALRRLPNVLEAFVMAGDCDIILRVVVRDLVDYRRLQANDLTRIEGISNVKSDIPMETIKLTHELPI